MRTLLILNISYNNDTDLIISNKEYNKLKTKFISMIKAKLKLYKNKIFCDLTKSYITVNEFIGFFKFSKSINNKEFKIEYANKLYKGIHVKRIIKSIDYGTMDITPKRIFYPIFNEFKNNYFTYFL